MVRCVFMFGPTDFKHDRHHCCTSDPHESFHGKTAIRGHMEQRLRHSTVPDATASSMPGMTQARASPPFPDAREEESRAAAGSSSFTRGYDEFIWNLTQREATPVEISG
ncbi:unnamed protein product [Prorocentrum cordatum]|uniref:Uncharacterized protein n=1 Tax=Prorocentrum cordatum TaxID=2364126 RepID=A0ABN9SZN9_9DINO|nr:unnamed protein product [Polarella glacialis]